VARTRTRVLDKPIIPCNLTAETKATIIDFAEALKMSASTVGSHGLSLDEFLKSGIFEGAIERLRGQQAATMSVKRGFVAGILDYLRARGHIAAWKASGSNDRHDYEVKMPDGWMAVIEAKGCLDGNNTNIFERPPQADEFILWSLCQNAGANPRKNAWSGIHVRLSADIIHRGQRVDGLIIWDMLCGTIGRPCPKLQADERRATVVGDYRLPPPCIYLFPRTIPDPRNNPTPPVWTLHQTRFLAALHKAFSGDQKDVTEVHIAAGMANATVTRSTTLTRDGQEIISTKPTRIKRAKR
jgi:hypothetical protein